MWKVLTRPVSFSFPSRAVMEVVLSFGRFSQALKWKVQLRGFPSPMTSASPGTCSKLLSSNQVPGSHPHRYQVSQEMGTPKHTIHLNKKKNSPKNIDGVLGASSQVRRHQPKGSRAEALESKVIQSTK